MTKRPVTLIVDNDWTGGDRYKVVLAWLERANRVYPHIKTELRDNAASQDKTIALFATEEQGDLYQLDQHMVPVFGPKGVLEDISSTLAALKFDVNSVFDVPNITHWNGKRHGLLIQLTTSAWVYNKSLFQQLGITEPTEKWNWNDHVEAARRLTNVGENRWGTTATGDIYPWYWSAEVPYLDKSGTKTLFDTSGSREILQWLADLVVKYRVAPSPAEAAEKKPNFNTGGYGMVRMWSPGKPLTRAIDGRFEWEIMPAPMPKHPKSGKGIHVAGGHNYLVTKKATQRGHLREAGQVLIELYHKEIQELYLTLSPGSLPILKSVATSPAALQPPPRNLKSVMDNIPLGKNYDKIVGFLGMHGVLNAEFAKLLNGQVSLAEAAINMQRLADAALAQAAR